MAVEKNGRKLFFYKIYVRIQTIHTDIFNIFSSHKEQRLCTMEAVIDISYCKLQTENQEGKEDGRCKSYEDHSTGRTLQTKKWRQYTEDRNL
jgi:hypothetical protein